MKAIVQDRYGGLDALEYRGIDQPVPKDNQVLVRVHAAGLDRGVWHVTAGLPYLIRFVGFGVRRPKVRVRGMDVAGTVEAVGSNVTRFQPGDEVFGWCDGSYAEYACASEDHFQLELVRSIGADDVVDYTRTDVTRRWDLIIDTAGRRTLSQLRRALTPTGTLVIVGGEGKGRWLGGFDRNLRAVVLSRVCGPAAAHAQLQAAGGGPAGLAGAAGGRQGHATHQPDLPAGRGPCGHPAPGRGPRRRQDRHHRVRRRCTRMSPPGSSVVDDGR
jgi:NADPH:quinone reductase-like Zn-dependent oxidoreductase